VDIERLQAAWKVVVERHAALRTVFFEGFRVDLPLEQIVLCHVQAEFHSVDLEADIASESELLFRDGSKEDSFGLGRLSHRLTLFRSLSGRCHLRLEISHSITDGGSLALMMHELELAYDGMLSTGPGPIYKDFLDYLSGLQITPSLDYWKQYLEKTEPCHFPRLVEGNRSPGRDLQEVSLELPLSAVTISEFCQRYEVTLFHIFQLAWALVLRTYLNRDDVCFGYATSGRDAPVASIEAAVGAFMNTLVCRVTLEDSKTVVSALKAVQDRATASLDHQHIPIAKIQRALDVSEETLFNTILGFQTSLLLDDNGDRTSLRISERVVYDPTEVCKINPDTSNIFLSLTIQKYSIAVVVDTATKCPRVKLSYWTDMISPAQANPC
jgi:hypothetical protein